METIKDLQWNQLSSDLDQLSVRDPNSLLHLLLQVNALIKPEISIDQTLRKINFLGYELAAQCENLKSSECLSLLNAFYFSQKDFQTEFTDNQNNNEADWLISSVIDNRKGSQLLTSLIYLHLSTYIHLPIFLINTPHFTVLKWVRSDHSSYIDLSQSGATLTQEQVLEKIQIWKEKDTLLTKKNHFDILPTKQILSIYLNKLIKIYKEQNNVFSLKVALDISLKSDGSQIKCLGERALIHKALGENEKALSDLKRFFNLTEIEKAPSKLREAYEQLKNDSKPSSFTFH